jgi:hypothetical protein
MASEKPLPEAQTRKKLFTLAKRLGCDFELKKIFTRYDELLKKCPNALERKQIAVMANVEVHKLFNFRNPLIIRGEEIIPGDPDWKKEDV